MARGGRGRFFRAPLAARLGLALLIVLAVPAGPGVRAIADGEISVGVADVDDSAFPDITAVITADRAGRPLDALRVEDVRMTEGGAAATVTSVRRAVDNGIPLALIFTVDTSGSMAGSTMDQAKSAASSLVERLGAEDAAAVIGFSDQVRIAQPLTKDKARALSVVSQLSALGNTALYDAVAESARVASEAGYVRRAVILLSDGREFGGSSRLNLEQSLDSAARGGAVFYTVGVGPDVDRAYLEEVARRSGGRFFPAAGPGDIPAIYSSLQELLRGQFIVTARSAASPVGASREASVEVRQPSAQGLAQRTYSSKRPASATTAPTATAAPMATPVLAPATPAVVPADAGGTLPVGPIAAGGAMLVVAAGGLYLRTRRSRINLEPVEVNLAPRPGAFDRLPAAGVLQVTGGPGSGTRFELAEAPATIGSAADCVVRLPEAEGVAAYHARLWWRDGKPMLHHLAEGYETRVNGRTVDWASLDAGYEIEIGTLRLRFEPQTTEVTAAAGADTEALRPGA